MNGTETMLGAILFLVFFLQLKDNKQWDLKNWLKSTTFKKSYVYLDVVKKLIVFQFAWKSNLFPEMGLCILHTWSQLFIGLFTIITWV